MTKFKSWLESLQTDKEQKVRAVWDDALHALVGPADISQAQTDSLSRITHRGSDANAGNIFKGKTAAAKKLAPIFDRLKALGPEFAGWVERTQQWLNNKDHQGNEDVGTLLRKLFGSSSEGDDSDNGWYDKLSGNEDTSPDQGRLSKAPAMPPQDPNSQTTPDPMMPPQPQAPQPQQQPPMMPPQMPQQRPQMPPMGV